MVVDPVGGDRFTDSLRCLAPLGRLLVLGFTAGDIPTVKVNRLLLEQHRRPRRRLGRVRDPAPGAQRRPSGTAVVPLLESGAVDPPVAGTVPAGAGGHEAVAALGERSVLGKFVVEPAG